MDFENVPLYWVNRLSFLVRRELNHRFEQAGHPVRTEEWAILMLLWRQDGRTPSELADESIRDRTTMTRFLDSMEKKGWLKRTVDPEDRRRVQVCLSPEGKKLKRKLVPIVRKLIRQTVHGLETKEIEAAVGALSVMTQNLLKPNLNH